MSKDVLDIVGGSQSGEENPAATATEMETAEATKDVDIAKRMNAAFDRLAELNDELRQIKEKVAYNTASMEGTLDRLVETFGLELKKASKLFRQYAIFSQQSSSSKINQVFAEREMEKEKFLQKRNDLKQKISSQRQFIDKLRQLTVNTAIADFMTLRAKRELSRREVPLPQGMAIGSMGRIRLAHPDNPAGRDFIVDHLRESDSFPLKIEQLTALSYAKRRGGVMIDVGANIGLTSIPPVLLGLVDRVVAFEPEQSNFDCLQWSIVANGLGSKIELHRVAIGGAVGEATLAVTEASGLHHLKGLRDDDAITYETIPMRSLDDVAAEIARQGEAISFVKIDTQGAELSILQGAASVLQQPAVLWEIEYWPEGLRKQGADPREVIDIMVRSFSYFVDEKAVDNRLHPISMLPEYAALISDGHHTDFLLIH